MNKSAMSSFRVRPFLILVALSLPLLGSLALLVCNPAPLFAQALTEFSTIKELRQQSNALERTGTDDRKWFEPNSNYGKIFASAHSPGVVFTWLGLLSSEYQLAEKGARIARPLATATGLYKSNRSDSPPVKVSVLIPHPRSISSRKLNLIADFTELEKRMKNAENHEKISVSGFPAQLAIDAEKSECSLLIDLPRLSVMFIEVPDCKDAKKLTSFTEVIDIFHLAQKLEK